MAGPEVIDDKVFIYFKTLFQETLRVLISIYYFILFTKCLKKWKIFSFINCETLPRICNKLFLKMGSGHIRLYLQELKPNYPQQNI